MEGNIHNQLLTLLHVMPSTNMSITLVLNKKKNYSYK